MNGNATATVTPPLPASPQSNLTPLPTPQPEKQELESVILQDTGKGCKVLMGEFEKGDAQGRKFAYPAFDSVQAAAEAYGNDLVLGILNQSIKSRVMTKVKNNKIPVNVSDAVRKQQLDDLGKADTSGHSLIFTIDEALAYKPGEREPGIKDLINDLIEQNKTQPLTPEQVLAFIARASLKSR